MTTVTEMQAALDGRRALLASALSAAATVAVGTLGALAADIAALEAAISGKLQVTTTPASPLPSLFLCFDQWEDGAPIAYPLLRARGLVGTYYVTPRLIDYPAPGWHLTTALLRDMQSAGWLIGGYPDGSTNMVTAYQQGGAAAVTGQITALKDGMASKGFPIAHMAAMQRAWSTDIANIARPLLRTVRVAANFSALETRPPPDSAYIDRGGSASLSGADTDASLASQLDRLMASGGGTWIVVIHRVGLSGDPYTLNQTVLTQFLDRIAAAVGAGRLRVETFDRIGTP